MLKITCYTAGILYLFYNFEMMLKSMEKDVESIREKPDSAAVAGIEMNQIKV